ncbi:MAG TPA: choice-of-anchor D domain-containing protein, partial [Candidatus Binataceae bacterium]|nr:choice-of-anchor D domain-containing protein [Candidatus Binataceae bacterium]
ATPTPVTGKLKVSPASLNFGTVAVGASKTKSVTIKNSGKITKKIKPLPILIEMESGVESPFSLTQACNDDDLAPGATCQVSVTFAPTAATPYSGTMTIEDNLEPSFSQNVGLKGKGK